MEFCTSGKKGSTLWPKLMPFKQDLISPFLVSFQGEVNKDSKIAELIFGSKTAATTR